MGAEHVAQELTSSVGGSGARQEGLVLGRVFEFVGCAAKDAADLFRRDHELPPVRCAKLICRTSFSDIDAAFYQSRRVDFFEGGCAGPEPRNCLEWIEVFRLGNPELRQVRVIEPPPKLFLG